MEIQTRKKEMLEERLAIATGLAIGAGQTALCLYEPSLTPHIIIGDLGAVISAEDAYGDRDPVGSALTVGVCYSFITATVGLLIGAERARVPGIGAVLSGLWATIAGITGVATGAYAANSLDVKRDYDSEPDIFVDKKSVIKRFVGAALVSSALIYGGHKFAEKYPTIRRDQGSTHYENSINDVSSTNLTANKYHLTPKAGE